MGGVDAAMDVQPDSGCNPDAGAADIAGWHFFGAPLSASPSGSYLPTMALLSDGRPVVAWTDAQPQSVITQFASFDLASRTYTSVWKPDACGGAWQAMGDPVAGTLPALLVPRGSDQPVRAWVSNDNPSVLTVERWNGTAFVPLGAPFQALNQSIVSPVMVADAGGNPFLGWLDGPSSSTVRVAHWDGSAWQMLSPAGGVPGDLALTFFGAARALSLTLTPDGLPIVAWGTQGHAVVAEFVAGTTWTTLGTAPNSDGLSHSINGPIVRVNSASDVFLAWIFPQVESGGNAADLVSVSLFDGTTWQAVGGPLYSAYVTRDYDMIIDGSGAPIVADSESALNGGGLVYTYRWNGTAWQKPAPGVAAGGPPMQTYVYSPTIALDGSGRLIAAWVHLENSMEYINLPGNVVTTAIAVARYQP